MTRSTESGIGKYGLGLKKSATALGDKWKVVSTAKGSDRKYTVDIDVLKLFQNNSGEVTVKDTKAKENEHGTRIEIDLRRVMKGRAEKSVKASISEMYRFYMESGDIRIWWNEEQLEYDNPCVRETTLETLDGTKKEIWWSSIELPVKSGNKKVATVTGKSTFSPRCQTPDQGYNYSIAEGCSRR